MSQNSGEILISRLFEALIIQLTKSVSVSASPIEPNRGA